LDHLLGAIFFRKAKKNAPADHTSQGVHVKETGCGYIALKPVSFLILFNFN